MSGVGSYFIKRTILSKSKKYFETHRRNHDHNVTEKEEFCEADHFWSNAFSVIFTGTTISNAIKFKKKSVKEFSIRIKKTAHELTHKLTVDKESIEANSYNSTNISSGHFTIYRIMQKARNKINLLKKSFNDKMPSLRKIRSLCERVYDMRS